MNSLGIRLLAVLTVLGLSPFAFAGTGVPEGAVFTMTHAPTNDEILMDDRGAGGALSLRASFATDGAGTGTALGNQGAVIFREGFRWLFAVNAGSDEISVFRVLRNRIALVGAFPSGGQRPAMARDRSTSVSTRSVSTCTRCTPAPSRSAGSAFCRTARCSRSKVQASTAFPTAPTASRCDDTFRLGSRSRTRPEVSTKNGPAADDPG